VTLFGQRNEAVTQPASHPRRVEVQLVDPGEPTARPDIERHQADDRAVELGDGDIEMADQFIAHPPPDFLLLVDDRDIRQRVGASAQVHVGTRSGITGARRAKHRLARLQRSQHALQTWLGDGHGAMPLEPLDVLALTGRRRRGDMR